MVKLNIRFGLLEIENPIIYNEIQQALQQGIKAGDTVKRLLLESVYNRELINVLQGSIMPSEPLSNEQMTQFNDENLFDILD